jgi:uncharacterized membrane protein HdeD (DUF308 family)
MIILGLIAVVFPAVVTGIVVFLIAFILILMGGMYLSLAIYGAENEKNWVTWVKSFVMLGIGLLMLTNGKESAAAIALILGIFFLIMGFFAILLALGTRPAEGWYLFIVDAVVAFLLGITLFIGWPEYSTWMLGFLLGLDLLMEGTTLMVMASSAEKELGLKGGE